MQQLSLVYLSVGLLLVAHDVLSGAEDIDFLVLAAFSDILYFEAEYKLIKFSTLFHIRF